MIIQCRSCGKSLQIDDKFVGKQVKCPCSAVLTVPGAAAVMAPAAAAAAARPNRANGGQPAATAFGIDRAQMSSLFGELTENDMVVKGQSTDTKAGKKQKDPLAAYQPAASKSSSTTKPKATSGSAKTRSAGGKGTLVTGILMMVGAVVWFVVGYAGGVIFFYPPVLFVLGLIAVVKALLGKS
ncbi:MAG: hypothetical protein ACO1RT_09635 [Planctomycetaceae bacterium]